MRDSAVDTPDLQLRVLALVAAVCLLGPTLVAQSKPADNSVQRLDVRHLESLIAFASLYGYVRHFHPSDGTAAANWSQVAECGVEAVEGAKSDHELAVTLRAIFKDMAPTVHVFESPTAPATELTAPSEFQGNLHALRWEHHGFGQDGATGPYYSKRQMLPSSAVKMPIPARLGRLSATIPTVLYADSNGTFPHGVERRGVPSITCRPTERTRRLAGVIIAWNVLKYFYPYFDEVDSKWDISLVAALNSAATDHDPRQFLSTLRRLVAGLHDGHARVTWSKDDYCGPPIGWDLIEGRLTITHVPESLKNTNLKLGDIVLDIDGIPVHQALEKAAIEISGATSQWITARALGIGLHYREPLGGIGDGPATQPLSLTVEAYGDASHRTISLKRDPSIKPFQEIRPAPISVLRPQVMYIDLTRVTDSLWSGVAERLNQATNIIFDLRGYPALVKPEFLRHLTDAPLESPHWRVPTITEPNREGLSFSSTQWSITSLYPKFPARIFFLADARAISYSETILSMVASYGLGQIVGDTTAGTNGTINTITLLDDYHLVWTGMKVLNPDGSKLHGIGIKPTHRVVRSRLGVAAAQDEVLERALALSR